MSLTFKCMIFFPTYSYLKFQNTNERKMKRREIIKYTAWMSGATLSAPLLSSIMTGCKSDPKIPLESGLKYFSNEEFEIVSTLVDLIIPKTDSPSGTEVGVHHTIDHMVDTVYDDNDKEEYNGAFQNMAVHLSTLDFFNKTNEEQTSILSNVLSYSDPGLKEVKRGLQNIRQQSIAFYLSNEEIATQYLNYLPVPGKWEPCTPLAEVEGKAWAI